MPKYDRRNESERRGHGQRIVGGGWERTKIAACKDIDGREGRRKEDFEEIQSTFAVDHAMMHAERYEATRGRISLGVYSKSPKRSRFKRQGLFAGFILVFYDSLGLVAKITRAASCQDDSVLDMNEAVGYRKRVWERISRLAGLTPMYATREQWKQLE